MRRLIQEGELVGFKVGRQWRVEERNLSAYVRRQKKKEAWREKLRGDPNPSQDGTSRRDAFPEIVRAEDLRALVRDRGLRGIVSRVGLVLRRLGLLLAGHVGSRLRRRSASRAAGKRHHKHTPGRDRVAEGHDRTFPSRRLRT